MSSCLMYVPPLSYLRFRTNPHQPNEFPQPTIKDTALYRLPVWAYNRLVGRILNKQQPDYEDEKDQVDADEVLPSSSSSGAEDFEVLEKVKTTAQNGNGKAARKSKKGGRGR